jgi:hypothetical protein
MRKQAWFVANGGNNALAVIDLGTGRLAGLVPTGWYPGRCCCRPTGAGCKSPTPSAWEDASPCFLSAIRTNR